jgi:chemotaxis protein histidine kinase CheA
MFAEEAEGRLATLSELLLELHELTRSLDGPRERTLQARMVPFGTVAEPLRRAGRDRVVAGPAAGSRPFTPEGQDAARYR